MKKIRKTDKHEIDMTRGSLLTSLISFAIPLILSGVIQLAFNTADLIVVGRFAGENSLAAVGSNTSVISLIVNIMLGICTGTSVMAARFYGAKDAVSLKETVDTSVITGLAGGIIFGAIGIAISRPLLILMGTPDEVLPLAVLYLRIYMAGLPVMQLYNFSAAILKAVGDSKRPLYYLMAAGVINVGLNLFFVIVLKMDVAGVALATVISQVISCILTLMALIRSKGIFRLDIKNIRFSVKAFRPLMRIGIPAGIQSSMYSISNVLIQSSINSFGAMVMAGNSAAASIEAFLFVSLDAVNQSSIACVSQNVGAQSASRVRKTVIYCMLMEFVLAAVVGGAIILFSRQLLGIYTGQEAAIQAGIVRMTIMGATFFLNGMQHMMGGVMRSIGYSLLPTFVSIFGICVFRVFWIFTFFASYHTLEMLYASYPISWILTLTAHIILYLALRKRKLSFIN